MLTFDPATRITVTDALDHPWLASYHEVTDEPECPIKFEAWRKIEELETIEEFREALWTEIEDYRKEVRGINIDLSALSRRAVAAHAEKQALESTAVVNADEPDSMAKEASTITTTTDDDTANAAEQDEKEAELAPLPSHDQLRHPISSTDPVVTYARRSSLMQPSRQASTYNSPLLSSQQHLPAFIEGHSTDAGGGLGAITFPAQGFVVPGRSRTTSIAGGEVTRKLLRTLSTVSIYESAQGLPGGLAEIAPIGRYIVNMNSTAADAPPSEMPRDFGLSDYEMYGTDEHGRGDTHAADEKNVRDKDGMFRIA
jgi:hypothetical protein